MISRYRRGHWSLAQAPIPDGPVVGPNATDLLHAELCELRGNLEALAYELRAAVESVEDAAARAVISAAIDRLRALLVDSR